MQLEFILNKIDKSGKLPDDLFINILETQDALERQEKIEQAKLKLKALGRTREFTNLLGAWQTKYAQNSLQQASNKTEFTGQALQLFTGQYVCKDSGISYLHESKNSQTIIQVCPHPLLPVERLVNLDTNNEKIKLAFFKDEKWQEVTADCGTVYSRTNICSLADRGLMVTTENSKDIVKYISETISKNMQIIPKYNSISRFGWLENGTFAPYVEDVKYDGDDNFSNLFTQIKQEGYYPVWLEHIKELRENIYIKLLMATSFASPLIEKVNALCFVTHLWGTTGFGKTVSLMVAMSIWGNPEIGGLVRTMNMTQNSMARTSAFLYNIPFAADELQQIKNKWDNYDNLIMYLTEGIDRGRAKAKGGVEEVRTWKNSFIFTGEEPVTKSDSGGGVKNRVIEIEVDQPIIQDGNLTATICKEHYGGAGKIFIEYLRSLNQQELTERYRKIFKDILKEVDTTEKQAMSMALILLADELACECIFTHEKPLNIQEVKRFLHSTKAVDVSARAYEWVIDLVAENQIRFTVDDNKGALWGKIEKDHIIINKKVLEEQLNKNNYDYSTITKAWDKKGLLVRNSQNKLVHQTKVFGIKANYIKIKTEEPNIEDMIASKEQVADIKTIPF